MKRTAILAALAALWLNGAMGHAAIRETAQPVAMPQGAVDVALLLAVDVSSSVNAEERRFQRIAYARALADPLVIRAALGGRHGRIALGFMEWSGPRYQHLAIPVHVIDTPEGIAAFVTRIEALAAVEVGIDVEPYSYFSGTTAMGNALLSAADALRALDVPAGSVVIDLSADGINNDGAFVDEVRDQLVAQGFVINGLPISMGTQVASGQGYLPDDPDAQLEAFFANCVVGGRGAFQIMARGWEDVEEALRAKLILELAGFDPAERSRLAHRLNGDAALADRITPAQFTLDLGARAQPVKRKVDCNSGRLRPPMPSNP